MFTVYQCGDQVLYGIHGVCKIIAVESRKVDRRLVEYYVLEPVNQPDARFYIPTQNQAAVAKLRPMITQQELNDLLYADDARSGSWIPDENARKQYYKELITSGDRRALLQMVHTLHAHKKEQEAAGKKVHLCDQNFLRDAEKLLSSEFSLVLNIDQDEVGAYVKNAIDSK